MKTAQKISAQSDFAFSLVELLVVIAVIAIVASLAIPNIANISNRANYAKNQKNAQNIASVAAQARAAGYSTNWTTVPNAIELLTNNGGAGIAVRVGSSDIRLGISGLSSNDVVGATDHLSISSNTTPDILEYTP